MNEEIINNATYHIVTKRDQILKDTIIQKLGYVSSIETLVIRMKTQKRGDLEFFELDGKVKVKQNYKILF